MKRIVYFITILPTALVQSTWALWKATKYLVKGSWFQNLETFYLYKWESK